MRRSDTILGSAFLVAAGHRYGNKEWFVQVHSPVGQSMNEHAAKEPEKA